MKFPLQAGSGEINFRILFVTFLAWMLAVGVAIPQFFVWAAYSVTQQGTQKMFTQCVTQWTIKILEEVQEVKPILGLPRHKAPRLTPWVAKR